MKSSRPWNMEMYSIRTTSWSLSYIKWIVWLCYKERKTLMAMLCLIAILPYIHWIGRCWHWWIVTRRISSIHISEEWAPPAFWIPSFALPNDRQRFWTSCWWPAAVDLSLENSFLFLHELYRRPLPLIRNCAWIFQVFLVKAIRPPFAAKSLRRPARGS